MDMRGYQQYKEQSVNSMTQGELLLVLFDELVKRSTMAGLALEKQEYPLFEDSVDRCMAIVEHLNDTLDRQFPISQNLSQLYEYLTYELGRSKIGRNKKALDHVRSMLTELRDTFRTAEKNSSSGH